MTILRATIGVALAALLTLIGCDAFGLSRVDDRRATERYERLHPTTSSLGVMVGPRPVVTGTGMTGE